MKHFISKLFKEKKLFELNVSYHDKDEEYHLLSFITGTAFYIGTGRFVTSFHLILEENKQKAYSNLIILYKDKIIHIDNGLQYDSISNVLVLHSSSEDVKDLFALQIGIPEMHTYGDVISGFDYESRSTVDIKIPWFSFFFLGRNQYDWLLSPWIEIKPEMSGSALIYKNEVIGIFCASSSKGLKFSCFASSLNLLNLLKSPKMSCNTEECINDGIDHLINEAKDDNEYALESLKVFMYNHQYVQSKYYKSF